jgi:nucleotide-binding universal stress UspA family protein
MPEQRLGSTLAFLNGIRTEMEKENCMNSNKKVETKKQILLWAVDPAQNPEDAKNLVQELKVWAKKLDCAIRPVSIFSRRFLRFPLDMGDNGASLKSLEKAVKDYVRKTGLKDVLDPEIVFVKETSTRKKAQALAKIAADKKAKMIFANTHAKATNNPFRLGGFAEALVACSRVPVLLLNPNALPSEKVPSILFPTDFSRDSRNALTHLVPLAKAFDAKIHLFNQLEGPTYYAAEFAGYSSAEAMQWEMILKDVEAGRKRHAHAWMRALKGQGIECDATLMHQKKSTISDILDFAKKSESSIIAMATRSSTVSRFILGSIARDILLRATCPVIICYRPRAAMPLSKAPSRKAETLTTKPVRQRESSAYEIQPLQNFSSRK